MPKRKRSHPFGSALLGGAIVAVFGLLALATGLVSTGGGSTTTREVVSASGTTPAAAVTSDEASGNTVNQIYKADAQRRRLHRIESRRRRRLRLRHRPRRRRPRPHQQPRRRRRRRNQVSLEEGGQMYTAEVVGTEPNKDLALLKVDAPAVAAPPAEARRLRRRWKSATRWSRSATRSTSADRDQRHRLRPAA